MLKLEGSKQMLFLFFLMENDFLFCFGFLVMIQLLNFKVSFLKVYFNHELTFLPGQSRKIVFNS